MVEAGLTNWFDRACGLLPELPSVIIHALRAVPRTLRPAAVDAVLAAAPLPAVLGSEIGAELARCWDGVPLPAGAEATIEKARHLHLLEFIERAEAFAEGPEAVGRFLRISDLRPIDEPVRKGRSVVVLTASFGPWSWVAVELARRGYRTAWLDLRPPPRRPWATRPYGPGLDLVHAPSQGWARPLVRAAKSGGTVVVALADEMGGVRQGHGALLGRPASVASTPLELARRLDLPLVPAFAMRHGDAWELAVDEPLKVSRGRGRSQDLDTNTSRWLKVLERWVRRHPDHYVAQLHIRRASRYDDRVPLFDDARPAPKPR